MTNDYSIIKFRKICTELIKIKKKKQENYGTLMFELYGLKGIFVNILNKALRLYNLIWLNKKSNFEPIRDSLIDLANYSIIAIMEIDKKKNRKV